MTSKATILVIEDEEEIRKFLAILLPSHNFTMLETPSGEEGLQLLGKTKIDAVILDLGLPGIDGLQTLVELRKKSAIPVLILSVRDHEDDKVTGLELGADDYLTKPFGAKELIARLHVLLRKKTTTEKSLTIQCGRLLIDKEKRLVSVDATKIKLSDTEYKLLLVLAESPGKLFTHRELLRAVWPGNVSEHVEYLRVYINHLRQKIEDNPSRPSLIMTEAGIGYRFIHP